MTYNPQIPLVTESPQNSASPIQVNFSQFASIFSSTALGVVYNHMPLNDGQQGKHGAILFQEQTQDPGVDQNLAAIYPKEATSAAGNQTQLFLQIPKFLPTDQDSTNAPNDPMQLTYNSVGLAGPVYYSFLPGGYLFFFGSNTLVASSPTTITLSPTPTKILIAIATPNTVDTTPQNQPLKISTNITSATTFDVYVSFAPLVNYNFNWMAIATV